MPRITAAKAARSRRWLRTANLKSGFPSFMFLVSVQGVHMAVATHADDSRFQQRGVLDRKVFCLFNTMKGRGTHAFLKNPRLGGYPLEPRGGALRRAEE